MGYGRGEAGDWWSSDLTASTHDGLKLMGDVDNLGYSTPILRHLGGPFVWVIAVGSTTTAGSVHNETAI